MSIIGPFPDWMYEKGKLVKNYFTKEKLIFMDAVKIYKYCLIIYHDRLVNLSTIQEIMFLIIYQNQIPAKIKKLKKCIC